MAAAGRISQVLTQEGDQVHEGMPLVQLDSAGAAAQVAQAEAGVRSAEVELASANSQVEPHRLSVEQQKHSVAAARAILDAEIRQLERLQSVANPNGISEVSIDIQRQKVDSQKALVEVEELRLRKLAHQDPQERIDAASASLDRSRANLSAAKSALADMTLRAPSDGTILRLAARPGEIVNPANPSPLVWFVEDAPRILRAEVNHRFARRLRDGLSVLIYDDETNELLGKGSVARCSPWITEQRPEMPKPFEQVEQRTLECIVALTSPPDRLWIGEQVRIVIQTEPPTAPVAPLASLQSKAPSEN
jgi:HlyD family secretion protein